VTSVRVTALDLLEARDELNVGVGRERKASRSRRLKASADWWDRLTFSCDIARAVSRSGPIRSYVTPRSIQSVASRPKRYFCPNLKLGKSTCRRYVGLGPPDRRPRGGTME
jgi:hypothetical protein